MSDPFLDAIGVTLPAPKAAAPKVYDPTDAAVRTVMAEESDPEARRWVAGVIKNRAKKSGGDFLSVVREKGQFEPWADEANRIANIDPNSEDYKRTAADIGPILRGEVDDPSGGMTHFYAPDAQAELAKKDGRPSKAEFDDGTGVQRGRTLFFKNGGAAPDGDDFLNAIGVDLPSAKKDAATASTKEATGSIPFRELKDGGKVKGFLSKDQEELYASLNKGGGYKPNDADGSPYNPFFMQDEAAEQNVPPGAYYVTRDGTFKRAAGGAEPEGMVKVGRGAMRGFGDVATTVMNAYPGAENYSVPNMLKYNQKVYDADLKGDPLAGLARFTGQALTAAPVMASVEAATAPMLAQSALGRFALGEAGTKMAPRIARIATRGGSLATKGAISGAEGAGLVSSASDAPLPEQLGVGAIAGGALGPMLPAVVGAGAKAGGAVRDMASRWTYGGREKAIDRLLGSVAPEGYNLDSRILVPGSYPTMAEAAGEAGISAVERNARTNPKLAQVFADRMDQNAAARKEFFEAVAKDPEAITAAETARDTATGKLRATAFKDAKEADPDPVIAKIAEILASPSGQRDTVVSALSGLPAKLARQTDVEQLYGIRKDIGDMLDPRASSDKKGAQLAASELMAVKAEIDKAIEKAAPGFKGYLKTYSDMSKPIDEMKLLQGLKLTDQQGNITLAKINSAIDKIETKRKAGGTSKEKSVSADTLAALKRLQADLKRATNIMKGKAPGSDTAQNLAMQKFAEGGGVPLGVSTVLNAKLPGAGLVLGAANKAMGGQNEKMLGQLSSRLLQPTPLKAVVVKPVKDPGPVSRIALPALGGMALSRIVGQ